MTWSPSREIEPPCATDGRANCGRYSGGTTAIPGSGRIQPEKHEGPPNQHLVELLLRVYAKCIGNSEAAAPKRIDSALYEG
jgi:hypothetical protein